MPRPSKEIERRDATIRAAWASLARNGLEGTTIEVVAALGGFSKGVIHYYYDSKKALLLAAFEAFLASYDEEILGLLAQKGSTSAEGAPGGQEVLNAIVEASLPPFEEALALPADLPLPQPEGPLSPAYKARLFLVFFSLALGDGDFGAVIRRNYDRQVGAMAQCMGAVFPEESPEELLGRALGLAAAIDGFALHRVLGFLPLGAEAHGNLARKLFSNGSGSEARP